MNHVEFFRRAYNDPAFRRQKLDDQRHFRNWNLGVLVFSIAVGGGFAIYSGLTGGGWMSGLKTWLPLIALTAWMHSLYQSRIAALDAMDAAEVAHSAERTGSAGATRSA